MEKTFCDQGVFVAFHAATKFCTERGYTVGTMDGRNPIGIAKIAKGVLYISKWHNFGPGDEARLDGRMTGNFRDGPVTVIIEGEPI